MSDFSFSILYFVCLAVLIGLVQVLINNSPDLIETDVYVSDQFSVAVPPKPDVNEAFREGEGLLAFTYEQCERYEQPDLKDYCFHSLARQQAARDLDGALIICDKLSYERLRLECIADSAEVFSRVDLDLALEVCPTIPKKKWSDQCFFGIAMQQLDDPVLALGLCDRSGMWLDFCRHDVLGELSVTNLDFVLAECSKEKGDLLRKKTCWHGIGKYVGRQDLDLAYAACEKVPLGPNNLYRENCIHGLGWAAGERFGAEGTKICKGSQKDSCFLGVAFSQRLMSVQDSIDICNKVSRQDLKNHCLDFINN